MKVVLDTNVFVSALLVAASPPALLLARWRRRAFTLLTTEAQLAEIRRVTRYPKIRERIKPALAGRLINEIRRLSTIVENLPIVDASPDPYDNYLLSIAESGRADFLVTGDKTDLLSIKKHANVAIISISEFLDLTK